MSHTTLHLFKQNFKFSSAHFLIFNEHEAEKLHGHNYRVRVDIQVEQTSLASSGYAIDFKVLKKMIKNSLDQWDEHVLLPKDHPDMRFNFRGPSLEVRFRDRFYVFPQNEAILLPVLNTSVEQLSKILAENWMPEFRKLGVSKLRVRVEETKGQAASFSIG